MVTFQKGKLKYDLFMVRWKVRPLLRPLRDDRRCFGRRWPHRRVNPAVFGRDGARPPTARSTWCWPQHLPPSAATKTARRSTAICRPACSF